MKARRLVSDTNVLKNCSPDSDGVSKEYTWQFDLLQILFSEYGKKILCWSFATSITASVANESVCVVHLELYVAIILFVFTLMNAMRELARHSQWQRQQAVLATLFLMLASELVVKVINYLLAFFSDESKKPSFLRYLVNNIRFQCVRGMWLVFVCLLYG